MTLTPTKFRFDPDADYYELFELCMSDGTTEALNDPESFDEFLVALKDGRYDPETGITPASGKREQAVENLTYPQATPVTTLTDAELLTPAKYFQACLDDCDMTEIFEDADRWQFHIGKNIAAIADLCNVDNPVALTGAEPAWLLELFKVNGVATC